MTGLQTGHFNENSYLNTLRQAKEFDGFKNAMIERCFEFDIHVEDPECYLPDENDVDELTAADLSLL